MYDSLHLYSALLKLRQEDCCELEASLCYVVKLKTKQTKNENKTHPTNSRDHILMWYPLDATSEKGQGFKIQARRT